MKKVVLCGLFAASIFASASYASDVRTIVENGVTITVEKVHELPLNHTFADLSENYAVGYLLGKDENPGKLYRYNLNNGEIEYFENLSLGQLSSGAVNNKGSVAAVQEFDDDEYLREGLLGEPVNPLQYARQVPVIYHTDGTVEVLSDVLKVVDEHFNYQENEAKYELTFDINGINEAGDVTGTVTIGPLNMYSLMTSWVRNKKGEVRILGELVYTTSIENNNTVTGYYGDLMTQQRYPGVWDKKSNTVTPVSSFPGIIRAQNEGAFIGDILNPNTGLHVATVWDSRSHEQKILESREVIPNFFHTTAMGKDPNGNIIGVSSEASNPSTIPGDYLLWTKYDTVHRITDLIDKEERGWPISSSVHMNRSGLFTTEELVGNMLNGYTKAGIYRITVE